MSFLLKFASQQTLKSGAAIFFVWGYIHFMAQDNSNFTNEMKIKNGNCFLKKYTWKYW